MESDTELKQVIKDRVDQLFFELTPLTTAVNVIDRYIRLYGSWVSDVNDLKYQILNDIQLKTTQINCLIDENMGLENEGL